MAKKYRGSSVKRDNLVEMYGFSELLKKIEAAGGNINAACEKAVDDSLEIVGNDMLEFMRKHKQTGATIDSYEQVKATSNGNMVNGNVGFDIDKGGLAAIFLDVGTPKQKPYFFRYYAVNNNTAKIKEKQQAALEEILRGLR